MIQPWRLRPGLLLGDPCKMFDECWIGLNGVKRVEVLTQTHFIVKIVQAIMTKAADHDPLAKFVLFIFLFKKVAAVELFGNEMVKCQDYVTMTKRAGLLIVTHLRADSRII